MAEELKKCVITRYDDTIKEPPYLTIAIDKTEVVDPKLNDDGVEFFERLRGACRAKGYHIKCYTMSEDKNFDYQLIVY